MPARRIIKSQIAFRSIILWQKFIICKITLRYTYTYGLIIAQMILVHTIHDELFPIIIENEKRHEKI